MALVNVHADFHDLVEQLRRIADALDRAIPALRDARPPRPMVFINTDPAAIAESEAEADRRREAGTEETA